MSQQNLPEVLDHEMEIDLDITKDKTIENTRKRDHKIGNTTYRGGDKIKPSNDTFAAGTAIIIIVPSLYIMTVV